MLGHLGGEFGSLGLFEGGTHSGEREKEVWRNFFKNIYLAVLDLSYGTWDL